MRTILAALVLVGATLPAGAQQPTDEWVFGADGEDLVLEVGSHLCAEDYKLRPWPVIELHYIRLPVVGGVGGGPERGFSFSPSYRVIEARDDDDYSDLAGLGDVDMAVELGAEVAYRVGMFRALAAVRRGRALVYTDCIRPLLSHRLGSGRHGRLRCKDHDRANFARS